MKNDKKLLMELPFEWREPVKSRPILLKAKKEINSWPQEWTKGFISSFGDRQSYKGGKLAIFKLRVTKDSGYMVIKGYDELNELFEVDFLK